MLRLIATFIVYNYICYTFLENVLCASVPVSAVSTSCGHQAGTVRLFLFFNIRNNVSVIMYVVQLGVSSGTSLQCSAAAVPDSPSPMQVSRCSAQQERKEKGMIS